MVNTKRPPIGYSSNRLTVIGYGSEKGKPLLLMCSCGRHKSSPTYKLMSGELKSCGCLLREKSSQRASARSTKHGWKGSPEYIAWSNIISRCSNPRSQAWKNYGARGISICSRWRLDFTEFIKDVGARPSALHSIDRYPDNNGNYEPGNVKWSTKSEQAKNRRARERDAIGRFA